MTSKFNYLINMSLKRKIKTKWFLVANLLIAILIIGVANIDSIITSFGGDFDSTTKVYVIDNTDKTYDLFSTSLDEYTKNLTGEEEETSFEVIKYEDDLETVKELIEEDKEEKDSLVLIFDNDDINVLSAKLVSRTTIDTYTYQLISGAVNSTKSIVAIQELGLSEEEYSKLTSPLELEREIINSSETTDDENMEMIMTTVFPIIILPFFMLSIFLVQMVGAEVNDEKTTKSMEIIISNVSPKTHFFAKVVAGNLFVILQAILLVIYCAIGLYIRKLVGGNNIVDGLGSEVASILELIKTGVNGDKLIYIIPLTLVLMLLTFVAYSLVAGILASMTTNTEDFQQVQTPIMIISLVGYYLAIMASMFKGALFIKIISFIPFISAILSPSLLVLGQISILEVSISIIIMILTIFILIKYGLKIYKVGILNYDQSSLWKKMLKTLKQK